MSRNIQKPHAWDIGKRFRRICKLVKIDDLRHFATTMLFMEGVADAIIRKMTGHRSDELERYKHFSPEFKKQTTELIAGNYLKSLEAQIGVQAAKTTKAVKMTAHKLLIIKR